MISIHDDFETEERTIKDNYLLSLLNGEIYMNNLEFQNSLDRIKGLTVAIVYIFEGEQAAGFAHYHIWKGDIISKCLMPLQMSDADLLF